jgi:hypothetical protein
MSEYNTGPLLSGTRTPIVGEAKCLAEYSGFKQFGTSVRILNPQK